jgi:hypothetical protein
MPCALPIRAQVPEKGAFGGHRTGRGRIMHHAVVAGGRRSNGQSASRSPGPPARGLAA